ACAGAAQTRWLSCGALAQRAESREHPGDDERDQQRGGVAVHAAASSNRRIVSPAVVYHSRGQITVKSGSSSATSVANGPRAARFLCVDQPKITQVLTATTRIRLPCGAE